MRPELGAIAVCSNTLTEQERNRFPGTLRGDALQGSPRKVQFSNGPREVKNLFPALKFSLKQTNAFLVSSIFYGSRRTVLSLILLSAKYGQLEQGNVCN